MVYLGKEAGEAIASIINSTDRNIEIEFTENYLKISAGAGKIGKKIKSSKKLDIIPKTEKNSKKKKYNYKYEFNGESHTCTEWAAIVGIDRSTMCKRLHRHGNPYGNKPATDKDIVGTV